MTEQQRIRAYRQVYDTYLASIPPHLRRLVRLMQSAADIFLGHMRVDGTDYYVRQYRDMKIIPKGAQIAAYLPQFAKACGRTLAKAHARSGDPAAVVEYIGRGVAFEEEILRFARAYADQTHADHAELVAAIAAGEVRAEEGVA
ncbi:MULTISPECIES: DUF2252 family protein [Microbacterium]|uniref:DUF2252 family protein n=1 Tax=Microbacterium TaxID=33882 RepID=UPI003306F827